MRMRPTLFRLMPAHSAHALIRDIKPYIKIIFSCVHHSLRSTRRHTVAFRLVSFIFLRAERRDIKCIYQSYILGL